MLNYLLTRKFTTHTDNELVEAFRTQTPWTKGGLSVRTSGKYGIMHLDVDGECVATHNQHMLEVYVSDPSNERVIRYLNVILPPHAGLMIKSTATYLVVFAQGHTYFVRVTPCSVIHVTLDDETQTRLNGKRVVGN